MADTSWSKTVLGGVVGAVITGAIALIVHLNEEKRFQQELAHQKNVLLQQRQEIIDKNNQLRAEMENHLKVVVRNIESAFAAYYDYNFEANQWHKQIDTGLERVQNWENIPQLIANLETTKAEITANIKDAERLERIPIILVHSLRR